MQALYLLDQHEDRLPGCAQLRTAVYRQTRAPHAELFDLRLVQTIAQDATVYDDVALANSGSRRFCAGAELP